MASLPLPSPSFLSIKVKDKKVAIIPIGILIMKIKGQLLCSIIQPPKVGPKVGPSTIPIPNKPAAMGLSLGSKASNKIACEVDNNAPPPIPCTKRQIINSIKLSDWPHK